MKCIVLADSNISGLLFQSLRFGELGRFWYKQNLFRVEGGEKKKKKHSVPKTEENIASITNLCENQHRIHAQWITIHNKFSVLLRTEFVLFINFQCTVKKREKKSQYQTTTQRRTVRNFPKMIVLLEYLGRLASIFLKKSNHSLAY